MALRLTDSSSSETFQLAGKNVRRLGSHDATPAQVALAWLLARSVVILPIPGTGSVEHLEDNLAATGIELSDEEVEELEAAA